MPIAAVAIWLLVIVGSYRYAERVFLLLTLAFVTYPIAMVLGHPDWKQVALHTVLPHVSWTKAYLLMAVALIGTTITPYIQLYTAGAVVDRGIGPDEYQYERVDAVSGAILSDLVSMCIIIATATVVHRQPARCSTRPPRRPRRSSRWPGSSPSVLFGIGLLGASALAAAVVPLSTSYAVAEAVGVERSVSKSFREAPLFLGLFTAQILIGAAVVLLPGNLFRLIVNTQVLEGVVTPITLVFVLLLANRRALLGHGGQRAPGPHGGPGHGGRGRARSPRFLVLVTVAGWLGIGADPHRRLGPHPPGFAHPPWSREYLSSMCSSCAGPLHA